MAYAFCLRFDAESEATIAALWQVLVDCGAGDEMLRLGYPPHLSLAVLDEEPDRGVVEDALRGLDQLTGFVVQLRNVQHFPETPIVWLAAEGGQALSLLHRQLLDRLPEASVRAHYRAGQWTPHVTLQMRGDVATAMRIAVAQWPRSIVARVAALELVQFPPVVVLASAQLA